MKPKKDTFPDVFAQQITFLCQFHLFKKMCQFSSLSPSVPHHSNFFFEQEIVQEFEWLGKNPICELATIKIQLSTVVNKKWMSTYAHLEATLFSPFWTSFSVVGQTKENSFANQWEEGIFSLFFAFFCQICFFNKLKSGKNILEVSFYARVVEI